MSLARRPRHVRAGARRRQRGGGRGGRGPQPLRRFTPRFGGANPRRLSAQARFSVVPPRTIGPWIRIAAISTIVPIWWSLRTDLRFFRVALSRFVAALSREPASWRREGSHDRRDALDVDRRTDTPTHAVVRRWL